MNNELINLENPGKVRFKIADYIALFYLLYGLGGIIWDGYRYVLLVLGMLWMILVNIELIKYFFTRINIPVMAFISFLIIYAIFTLAASDYGTTIGYLGSYFLYFIIFLMSVYYSMYEQKMAMIGRIMLYWITILCCFAILYYIKFPGAARLHATHRSDLGGYMIGGGYQLAYVCAIILPVFVNWICKKKFNFKILSAMLIMTVLIWKTVSMITIVTTLIGCFISFIFSGSKKRKSVSLIILVILVILFVLFRKNIGQYLIDFAGDRKVVSYKTMSNANFVRIKEIGMIMCGELSENTNSAFKLRMINYTKSLEDMLESPITGSLFKSGVSVENSNFNDSSIMTAITTWGILLTGLFFCPVISRLKQVKGYIGSVIVVVLTLLLNPSNGFSLYTGIYIILPCMILLENYI